MGKPANTRFSTLSTGFSIGFPLFSIAVMEKPMENSGLSKMTKKVEKGGIFGIKRGQIGRITQLRSVSYE
ncbi:MAG: hypothetical protein IJ011_01700 [Clostridia bacterium]|nr:hypothetical protein [Clostridia bacterium]